MENRNKIKDIAEKLGVSQNTVSVALRGGRGVSPKLREQIITVAGDMGYTTKRASAKISVLICSTAENFGDTYFFSDLYRLLCAKIIARGGHAVTINLDTSLSSAEIDQIIYKNNICGAILLGDSDKQLVIHFAGTKIPVVCCSFFYPDILTDAVIEDNFAGIYQLIGHLYQHNYRQIGFIGNPARYFSFFERYLYFKSACEQYSIPVNSDICILDLPLDGSIVVEDMISRLRAMPYIPEAFLCADNRTAVLTIKALEGIGYNIPHDVAVTGFDNNDLSRLSTPSVTTVDTMIDLQAETVVTQLWRKINVTPVNNMDCKRICLPVRIIRADSVDLEHQLSEKTFGAAN